MPYVIAEPCVDVKDGACARVCPVEAIYEEDHVPQRWAAYTDANREFFGDMVTGWGSPGGLADTYRSDKDHPLVAGVT